MSQKKTFVTLEQLKEINKTYPTPYHLYDEKGIRANAERLKKAFSWNKGYREYFAVKATPNPFILNILKEYGLFETGRVIQTGNYPEYHQIFRKMIQELQLTKPHYEEYLSILLRELFLLVSRKAPVGTAQNQILQKEMEAATQFFNEHFTENISVEDYALSRHMSTCWFIRSFKRYNGVTPMQYIVNLRITNAKTLLRTTTYSVSEVAAVVGYENPLYFSRLFKKQTGLPPSEFRNTNTIYPK